MEMEPLFSERFLLVYCIHGEVERDALLWSNDNLGKMWALWGLYHESFWQLLNSSSPKVPVQIRCKSIGPKNFVGTGQLSNVSRAVSTLS